MNNVMHLKALCKNLGAKTGTPAQVVLQNYLIERVLERIATSRFNTRLVLKGGVLVSSMLGLDIRTTMDLDLTARRLSGTHKELQSVFDEICAIDVGDDFFFSVAGIEEIRTSDKYPAIRLTLAITFMTLREVLKIDVTIGDKITPKEQVFKKRRLFEEGVFQVLAYNVETVLAEKLETVFSRGTQNTRMRDYYDIHILVIRNNPPINLQHLRMAFLATLKKRGAAKMLESCPAILDTIRADKTMADLWRRYGKAFHYATEISFETVCDSIRHLFTSIMEDLDNA